MREPNTNGAAPNGGVYGTVPSDSGIAKRRAGMLCWRKATANEEAEVDVAFELLIVSRRSRRDSADGSEMFYDKYTIPAGKFESNVDSSCEDCALRETLEEAGVQCRIVHDLGWHASKTKHGEPIQTRYFLGSCLKMLDSWQEDSTRERVWLPPEEALERVSHREDLAAVVQQGLEALRAGVGEDLS